MYMSTPGPSVPKKRGRRTKDEYYQTKKIDNVSIGDNVINIFLPVSIDECFHNPNIDMQMQIMSSTPVLTGYIPEKLPLNYSEIHIEELNCITSVSEEPVSVEDTPTCNGIIRRELYDLTLVKPGVDTTVMKTSIACWWCCHQFDGIPIHMPIAHRRETYKVHGIFCSYSCCYSYMKSVPSYAQKMYLLNYMFKEQTKNTGVILDHVKPAPPKEMLKLFGGPLGISEFRSSCATFVLNSYPMVYVPSQMEKITKNAQPKKFFKILPPSKVHKPAPVKLPSNSLGKILGIVLPKHD